MNGIKVEMRNMQYKYIDFTVNSDPANLYRYEEFTGKMRKLFGVGKNNYGKALRGKERQKVEAFAKLAYENNLPFVLFN